MASTREPLLVVEDVWASYGKKEILRGVSFTVARGEIVALLGGNGSGKTTTLKVIAGLLRPTKGRVRLGSEVISGLLPHEIQARGVGYLLQGGRVFRDLTVAENLGICRRPAGDGLVRQVTREALTFARLRDLWSRRAGTLSGGERQMLALEMVLGPVPSVLLLDEPSAGLAPSAVAQVLGRVAEYAHDSRSAALLVEQNVAEANRVADRRVLLAEGRVSSE